MEVTRIFDLAFELGLLVAVFALLYKNRQLVAKIRELEKRGE